MHEEYILHVSAEDEELRGEIRRNRSDLQGINYSVPSSPSSPSSPVLVLLSGQRRAMEAVRIVLSVAGGAGNAALMLSLLRSARLKPFEMFLLGLSVANLEEIAAVDVYSVLVSRSAVSASSGIKCPLELSKSDQARLTGVLERGVERNGFIVGYTLNLSSLIINKPHLRCRDLKFFTLVGEIGSILFTVVISVYRCQKLRMRVNRPVLLDGRGPARALAVSCAALALLFASPTLLINLDWGHSNASSRACPADFFQCSSSQCPTRNRIYKYSFLLLFILVPLLVVTLSGAVIVRILVMRTAFANRESHVLQRGVSGFQRSTVAILAAMTLFQLNWSVYLVLHLAFDPNTLPSWSQLEFLVTSFYSAVSPYVYGIGNNLFSRTRFTRTTRA